VASATRQHFEKCCSKDRKSTIRVTESNAFMSRPEDFRRENLKVWKELLESIFPLGIPSSAAWTDLRSMCSVLTKIASHSDSNHMFYPTHGGMDLLEAFPFEVEPGCLALRTGESMVEVVKPAVLLFESFGPRLEWAYFSRS
jgi:serine/threonine-protein kinase